MSRSDALDGYLRSQAMTDSQAEQLRQLANFKLEMVGEQGAHVISFPDVGSGKLYIDQTISRPEESPVPWFVNFGQNDPPVEFRDFSPDEQETILFGSQELKLPGLIVIDVVMNLRMTKEQMEEKFGRPQGDPETPALISLGKLSMQGKTLLAVELRRVGMEVVGMSGFSEDNLDSYWLELGEHPEELTREVAVNRVLARFEKDGRTGKKEKCDWSARKALDKLASVFENSNRPPLVICDMPGKRVPKEGEEERMRNIFDFIAENSMTMVGLNRFGTSGLLTEGKIDWRVIDDYVNQLEGCIDQLYRVELLRGYQLADAVRGDLEGWRLDHLAWNIAGSSLAVIVEKQPMPSDLRTGGLVAAGKVEETAD